MIVGGTGRRGLDPRTVIPERKPRSISQEETFHHNLENREACRRVLFEFSEQVGRRLRQQGLLGRPLGRAGGCRAL